MVILFVLSLITRFPKFMVSQIVLRDDLLAKRRQESFFHFSLLHLSNYLTWQRYDITIVHALNLVLKSRKEPCEAALLRRMTTSVCYGISLRKHAIIPQLTEKLTRQTWLRSYGRVASNPTVICWSDGKQQIGVRFLVAASLKG